MNNLTNDRRKNGNLVFTFCHLEICRFLSSIHCDVTVNISEYLELTYFHFRGLSEHSWWRKNRFILIQVVFLDLSLVSNFDIDNIFGKYHALFTSMIEKKTKIYSYCSQLLLCRIAHVYCSVLFHNHSRIILTITITLLWVMALHYALLYCFREKLWWTNFGTTVWNWKRGMVLIGSNLCVPILWNC